MVILGPDYSHIPFDLLRVDRREHNIGRVLYLPSLRGKSQPRLGSHLTGKFRVQG